MATITTTYPANGTSGSTQFGKFYNFCSDATLPICNIFTESTTRGGQGFPGCQLTGIPLSGGRHLTNLGTILLCGIAIVVSVLLLLRTERKLAAVGRREIQLFLIGFIVVEICEIFTVGGFPLSSKVRIAFTGIHLAAIAATSWILLLNAIVGFQLIDDGTGFSLGGITASALAIAIGTGYITLDTGFNWTGYWTSNTFNPDQSYALYVLYQLFPLICLVLFFVLETILVLRVLNERKPMFYLLAAALLFAIGQIFMYVISKHICSGTGGKINGTLFETLFTLLAVIMTWVFWSSITEDDWPMPQLAGSAGYE